MADYWKRKKLTQAQYDGIKNDLPDDELINIDDTSIALGATQFGSGGDLEATYLTATDATATLPNSINLGAVGVNNQTSVLLSTPTDGVAAITAATKFNGAMLVSNTLGAVQFSRTLTTGGADLAFNPGGGQFSVTTDSFGISTQDLNVTTSIGNLGMQFQTSLASQPITFVTADAGSNIGFISAGNLGLNGVDIVLTATGLIGLVSPVITAPNIGSGTGTDLVRDGTNQILLKTSSKRFKENIEDLKFDSSKILDLSAKSFNYISQPGLETFGWIAEEVDEVLPQLVTRNSENEIESVKYAEAIVLLVEEVKKLREKVIALEEKSI